MMNIQNISAAVLSVSRHEHKANFEKLVESMRAYANAVNTGHDGETFRADVALQTAATDFLRPYGRAAGAAFMAMVRADVALKKNADGVRVFSVPSGATVRKYLKTEVFPRIGLNWESCVKVGEKKIRAKKAETVDFGSLSANDVVGGMSAEKFAEFAAAVAARSAADAIAAD